MGCGLISDKLCIDPKDSSWKPLLLIIPLRLGLNEINSIYFESLKKCFEFSGSVGMIGGRPNQALYFIGYVGDEAFFLDPHTTQRAGTVGNKTNETEIEMDETFHQKYASRINFNAMDPSLAVVSFKQLFKINLVNLKNFNYFFSVSFVVTSLNLMIFVNTSVIWN